MKRHCTQYLLALGFALGASTVLEAQQGFDTIDVPGAASTQTWGINARGDTVGFYANADKVNHGFLLSGGRFTTIDMPGATSTLANGINPRGDIVAEYTANGVLHGVLLSGVTSTAIDFPGATGTEPIGINAHTEIVGDYATADKVTHGFLLKDGEYSTIDFPGATLTIPQSINPAGDIVGGYRDAAGTSHAFLLRGGKFTSLDYPGASFTTATGINPHGDIVGRYMSSGVNHGYVLSGGQFASIDYPGATFTGATAINPRGDILGRSVVNGVSHGFLLSNNRAYTVTDLGILGPPPAQGFYVASNSIVSGATGGPGGAVNGVLWYKGSQIEVSQPGLGGKNSLAFGVNAAGQAVGEAQTATADPEDFCGFKAMGLPSSGACLPFIWQHGAMTALPTLGGANGAANMINGRGLIAGVAESGVADSGCPAPQVHQFKPVLWDDEGVHELPTFAGDRNGVAFAVNDSGAAIGASGDCSAFNPATLVNLQPLHALLWEAGTVTDLGNLGGTGHGNGVIALNMNNSAEAVGASDLPGDANFHAFLWTRKNGMQDLGTLPEDLNSAGLGINDIGEVVGVSVDASFNLRAFIWQDGVMTEINTLIPANSSLSLILACSINARGEITGLAVDKNGDFHSYLATPSNAAMAGNTVASASQSAASQSAAKPMSIAVNNAEVSRYRATPSGMPSAALR
jgi:probable HAF family extracellular repeat protein